MSNDMKFYSRFTLNGSQPYMLTSDFDNGQFSKIPGTQWVPDYSMWQINNPEYFYSGEERKPERETTLGCSRCKKFVGSNGYVFWKTRRDFG
jgi:hypothetical protein